MYTKSQSFFKEKVGYCLSYAKNYKLEGTTEKTDDVVDGVLSLTNVKAYTECAGAFGGDTSGASPAPASGPASSPAEASAAPAEGSGKGPVVGGKELTCDDETYIKPTLDGLASTFDENYKSCNEETQKYTLEVSGYETELQAGKNGNSNQYGLGMMCVGGNMYYIYTVDTKQATWDALKASPPDESGVLLKCLLKEGSGGGGSPKTASNAIRTAVGAFALVGASLMA
jgi:hypothetical protein